MNGEATPRPWRAVTEGSFDQRHAAAKAFEAVMATRVPDCDECQFSHLTWLRDETDRVEIALIGNGPKATENAALIVEAVNAYDRLRAIEAAARDLDNLAPVDPNDSRRWSPDAVFALDALRSALDPSPPAEERKP